MTLFHVASLFCALGGAVILGIVLAGRGVPVVLLGVIVGLLGGWFAGRVLERVWDRCTARSNIIGRAVDL